MSSTSVVSLILVVLAVILVDVLCADITFRQPNPPESKSTTPWPALRGRYTTSNTPQTSSTTPSSRKKWFQQNNVWIRNEQAADGAGSTSSRPVVNRGRGSSTTNPLIISAVNAQSTSRPSLNRQVVDGAGSTSSRPALNRGRGSSTTNPLLNSAVNAQSPSIPPLNRGDTYRVINPQSSSSRPPLNRGDTYDVIKPQSTSSRPPLNRGDTFIVKPQSSTPKPMSYAGAVGPKAPSEVSTKATPAGPGSEPEELPEVDGSDASDEELREFSEALLKKDVNNAMKYVTLNLQSMTSSRDETDKAPEPLLKIDAAAYKIPSIEKIVLLYNNYFLEVLQNEVYTGAERIEENNFLDVALATPVMQYTRSFLIKKGKIGKDPKEFRTLLRQIWFYMYSRGQGKIGSSGFEHVFVAEIKNHQVSGLHNWLYFNEEETQKRANYLGYMKKLDLGDKGAILKYHFTFHDIDKPVGSMFIGTSPELEMALYSTCFLLRADKVCPLKMNGNKFVIRTFTFKYRGNNMIGSAFPEI